MSVRTRIAVLDDYQAVAASHADWDGLGDDVEVVFFHDHLEDDGQVIERLTGFDVVCLMRERTPFPRSLVERLPDLQLLVTSGGHNAAIDLRAAQERGVTVCGTDNLVEGTAELTWALILALARHVPQEDRAMRAGIWQQQVGRLLRGRTLGVLGLGRLGSLVAGYGHAFGMEVIAWSQNLTSERAAAQQVERVDKLELFARSDVLSVHVRSTERTRGLVGAAELGVMKPTAYLVNTSRSEIVDREALLDALDAGRLGGAALDVHPREPVPADDRVLRTPNTVLSPHVGFVVDEGYDLYYGQMVENVRHWLAGDPIRVLEPPEWLGERPDR